MKKVIVTIVFAVAFCFQTNAQVFMLDSESDPRQTTDDIEAIIPLHGVEIDQTDYEYTPLAGGILLLTAFAAVYLLSKKKLKN